MENFTIALNAVFPFLVFISIGYFTRVTGWIPEKNMNTLTSVVFKVFLPILMFNNIYNQESEGEFRFWSIAWGIGLSAMVIILLVLMVPKFVKGNPQRGAIIQAIYRGNFMLFALPLTESVCGTEGLALASMMSAFVIPLYNISAVVILEYYRGGRADFIDLGKKILANPLIWGSFLGLIFKSLEVPMPEILLKSISQMSGVATPLALFALGGTLHFARVGGNAKYLTISLFLKLVMIPAIIMGITLVVPFTKMERFLLLIIFADPIATASYPMAINMESDGELTGQFVVLSTVVSIVTIFCWIYVLKSAGLV